MKVIRSNIPTSFTRVALSEEAVLQGRMFYQQQLDVMQNRMADIAEEILNLTFSDNKDDKYGLQLAYLQGQLSIVSLQIAESTEANITVISNLKDEDN